MNLEGVGKGIFQVLSAAAAGIALAGLLIVRGHVTATDRARTHQTIAAVCQRVHRLDTALETLVAVSSSRVVLLHTAYYRDHPDELVRVLRQATRNQRILRHADCSASELELGTSG